MLRSGTMQGQATKPGDTTSDQAQAAGRDDLLASVAAKMPAEVAMLIANGAPESIAGFVQAHPQLRDPILMMAQRLRGNAFAQAVVAAATTVHKHPANGPGEPGGQDTPRLRDAGAHGGPR